MLLRQTESEARYDASTLIKVTALAERLQRKERDSLTASELEAIGTEVGLAPTFVRAALESLQEQRPATDHRRAQGRKIAVISCCAAVHALVAYSLWKAFPYMWALTFFLFFVIPVVLPPLIGLLTRRPKLGMAVGLALVAANLVVLGSEGLVYSLAGFPIAGALGWIGGWLRETPTSSDVRRRSLKQNAEPTREALIQELFTLQRQLEGPKVHRAFLSVGVAGAAELKRSEPELAVEYSFSEFRRWVGEIAEAHGGRLEPAVGDGVLCVLPDEAGAARAAHRLHQTLEHFNASEHRLSRPFRIRCGITGGEVGAASLNSGVRTHSWLVDHAIALQRSAAPGDILLSEGAAGPALPVLGNLSRGAEPVEGEAAFSWRGQSMTDVVASVCESV